MSGLFPTITKADHVGVAEFTRVLQRMYDTGNLDEVSQLCADEQVAVYRSELDTLRQYGLRKRVSFQPQDEGEVGPMAVTSRDGKNDLSYTNARLKWTEEFRTDQNKRTARFRRRGFAELRAIRIRDELRDRARRTVTCSHCGEKVTLRGVASNCPACGSQFRHEALSWLVTSFRLWSDPSPLILASLAGGLFLFAVIVGTIGQLRSGPIEAPHDAGTWELLTALSGPVVLSAVAIVAIVIFALAIGIRRGLRVVRHWSRARQITRNDPLFSRQSLDLIANRVLDADPTVLASPGPDGTIRNGGVYSTYLTDYQPDADVERATLHLHCRYYRYYRDAKGRGRVELRTTRRLLPLVRAWEVRTPVNYVPTQYSCPNCGSRQAVVNSPTQECAFCGTERTLAELDWALDR